MEKKQKIEANERETQTHNYVQSQSGTGNLVDPPQNKGYTPPAMNLLNKPTIEKDSESDYRLKVADAITKRMAIFGIRIEIADIIVGPAVTRFEFNVLSQTRMGEFPKFIEDIKACAETSAEVRIDSPVHGTKRVAIEVANKVRHPVLLREVLESDVFQNCEGKLAFAIGQDVNGGAIVADLTDMPHMLIVGAVGTGKSMALNAMIVSLLYRYGPEHVRFIMVDPKFVELSRYNGIPHMLTEEAITTNDDAIAAMDYLINEMDSRCRLFRERGVSNICEYNRNANPDEGRLPYLIFVVDEMADLMATNRREFERKLTHLARNSREAGIHIVLATQSIDLGTITGVIKANMSCRMTFKVYSPNDSVLAMNMYGAEKLLSKGDMLFMSSTATKAVRVQGAYVSNEEIRNIVGYLRANNENRFDGKIAERIFVSRKQMQENDASHKERYEQYIKFVLKADGTGYRVSSRVERTPAEVVIPTRYRGLPVTNIGERAFADCKELVSVTIPKYVGSIGEEAFANCDNLTTVHIAQDVVNIRDLAFFGCCNLKNVYYGGTQDQWQKIQIGSGNENLINATIHFKR